MSCPFKISYPPRNESALDKDYSSKGEHLPCAHRFNLQVGDGIRLYQSPGDPLPVRAGNIEMGGHNGLTLHKAASYLPMIMRRPCSRPWTSLVAGRSSAATLRLPPLASRPRVLPTLPFSWRSRASLKREGFNLAGCYQVLKQEFFYLFLADVPH